MKYFLWKNKMELAIIQKNQTNGQKYINIRKKSELEAGDWVKITILKEVKR